MFEFPSDRFRIFLTDLCEPEDNSLRLVVAEAKTLSMQEQVPGTPWSLSPIVITADSRRFEFVWEDYVAYLVRDESFAVPEREGPAGIFLERKSSAYLRFLEETTFATAVVQRTMRHWEINCLNHCIDVASFDEPIVRELQNGSEERETLAKPN
jgi:hypothetical protein